MEIYQLFMLRINFLTEFFTHYSIESWAFIAVVISIVILAHFTLKIYITIQKEKQDHNTELKQYIQQQVSVSNELMINHFTEIEFSYKHNRFLENMNDVKNSWNTLRIITNSLYQ